MHHGGTEIGRVAGRHVLTLTRGVRTGWGPVRALRAAFPDWDRVLLPLVRQLDPGMRSAEDTHSCRPVTH